MNKYTALIILLAVFLIAGYMDCMNRQVERYICGSFTSPWSAIAFQERGLVRWKQTIYSDWKAYRISDGDICHRETWDIKNNERHIEGE